MCVTTKVEQRKRVHTERGGSIRDTDAGAVESGECSTLRTGDQETSILYQSICTKEKGK